MASKARIEIQADGRAAEKEVGGIRRAFGNLKKDIGAGFKQGIGIGAGLGVANAIGGALRGAVDLMGDAVNAASDLEETTSKIGVVFGSASGKIMEMGKTSATALGMSENAALAAAGTYGNLFRAMGIAEDASADMSTGLVGLAADLASFNNMDPTMVLDKLRAGLSGETEPLKTLGVNLNQARIHAKAMEMGLVSATGKLDTAAKAQATYALILEDTTLAQGDFARTSDGLANQQRILAAELENASAEIGKELLPVMVDLAHFATDVLVPALKVVIDVIKGIADVIGGIVGTIGGAVTDMALNFGSMGDRLHEVADGASEDFQTVKDKVKFYMEELGMSFEDAAQRVEDSLAGTTGAFSDFANAGIVEADRYVAYLNSQLPGGTEEAVDATAAELGEAPGKMADELLKEQFRLTDATTELVNFMDQALSPIQEKAQLQGFLASEELAEGLASNIPLIRDKAIEMREEAEARLAEIDGEAAGLALANTFANGIDGGAWNAKQAAARLAAGVAGFLPHSEPKEGPLRGITRVGGDIVDTITTGIKGKLSEVHSTMGALSAALVPQTPEMALAGGGLGRRPRRSDFADGQGGGGDTINNFYITWEGEQPKGGAIELVGTLQRLTSVTMRPVN